MPSSPRHHFAIFGRFAVVTLATLVFVAPASAQQGGTIVLTSEVVDQLLTGLKAGQAERDAAAKEDTPYGRYVRASQAYAVAKPKCAAAQESWPQRAAANEKLNTRYARLTQKMVDAMQKQDHKMAAIYQDSAFAMMSPSCVVKEPEQPKDFYDSERAVEVRAEQAEAKASGWTGGELAMVKERTDAILRATPAGDISPAEKSAVAAKAKELKPLMGIEEQPETRAEKPASPPAPTPDAAAAAAAPTPDAATTAAANQMGTCMAKNVQAHQKELESLQKQAEAAQKAGDQSKLMAIAQRVQAIELAGCMGK